MRRNTKIISTHGFAPLFYNRVKWPEKGNWPLKVAGEREYPFSEADMTLPNDVLSLSAAQRNGNAVAQVDLNYASLQEDLSEIVALVLNQFIRSLGHVANLKRLRQEADYLASKLNLWTTPLRSANPVYVGRRHITKRSIHLQATNDTLFALRPSNGYQPKSIFEV